MLRGVFYGFVIISHVLPIFVKDPSDSLEALPKWQRGGHRTYFFMVLLLPHGTGR